MWESESTLESARATGLSKKESLAPGPQRQGVSVIFLENV